MEEIAKEPLAEFATTYSTFAWELLATPRVSLVSLPMMFKMTASLSVRMTSAGLEIVILSGFQAFLPR